MKRKFNILTAVIAGALATGSCGNTKVPETQPGPPPVNVAAYTVQPQNIRYYNSYPATVVALNEVQLRSEVNGFITGVYFREGSHVNKGDRLYEIDRRKYEAAFEAAKAGLEIARSNFQKAARDAERYEKLAIQDAIAKQIVEDSRTALENAKLQVKQATANLQNAETDFNYSLITAPFEGLTGFSAVKPGAFVIAGQTILTSLSSDEPVGVDFNIGQGSLSYMLKLQDARGGGNDSVFRVTLPDNSQYKHLGKLTVIDRAVDPMTGTIRIRVEFTNPEDILRPGMNCRLSVIDENSGIQLAIPAKATVHLMSENMVYLIEDNKVTPRRITLGPQVGDLVVVKEGLKQGDRIVLEGVQNLRPGMEVAVQNPLTYQTEPQN